MPSREARWQAKVIEDQEAPALEDGINAFLRDLPPEADQVSVAVSPQGSRYIVVVTWCVQGGREDLRGLG